MARWNVTSDERHPRAFPMLDPPPEGLLRLRARLEPNRRERARLLALAFVPSVAMAAALALFVVGRPLRTRVLPNHPALAELHATVAGSAVAGAVPVSLGDDVMLYWSDERVR